MLWTRCWRVDRNPSPEEPVPNLSRESAVGERSIEAARSNATLAQPLARSAGEGSGEGSETGPEVRMNIHEFQAKQILGEFGAPVPTGRAAHTPDEAADAFKSLGFSKAVIKAQIHAGGRGK